MPERIFVRDRAAPTALEGHSPAFRAFLAQLERVAASDASVLLSGESGSGKSAAARRLHELGPRAAGPLVVVSLAALAPTLVESELFGHVRGAFTGASRDREGCFRRAEGGTIVLDDVALLRPEAQVKLLRVLQERVVEPLGAESEVPVDVRVVSTCGEDPDRLLAAGRLREDLFWRLAVVPLHVPPLRARAEDVPLLVEHLVGRLAERLGVPPRSFSPAALARLAAHPWPGNVRELENAIARTLALSGRAGQGPESDAGAEPGPVEAAELDFLAEAIDGVALRLASEALAHGLGVEAMGEAMMEQALAEQRGNVSAAARQLGLTRRAFEYRRRQAAAPDGAEREEGDGEDAR